VIGENKAVEDLTVVVTGASSGVGLAAAEEFARRGARGVVVGRNPDRLAAAVSRVREAGGSSGAPEPDQFRADFARLDDVRALAAHLLDRYEKIDVLANNAGGLVPKFASTVDGYEATIQGNHLAPFLLTNLLLDLVVAAPNARVVTVVTEVYAGRLDFDNLQSERSHQFFRAYQRTKLCALLFAFELARQLEGTGATSNAVSPGPSKTRFGDDMSGAAALFPKVMKRLPIFASPEKGARTLLYATAASELDGVSGRFFFKSRERETKPITHDTEVAARLWHISEELCRLSTGSVMSQAGERDA
jgi:retinol dehydrogenase-12